MEESIKKQDNLICPTCNGNGFTRVPYHLAKEEVWVNCEECQAQGYIPGHQWDTYGRRDVGRKI
jgi:DnaJ-class molecular chaperone